MTVNVEDGVPVTSPRSGVAKPEYTQLRELMRQLNIGSSFFFPTQTISKERYVRNAMWRLKVSVAEFRDWKIITRRKFENNTNGVRLWRVS